MSYVHYIIFLLFLFDFSTPLRYSRPCLLVEIWVRSVGDAQETVTQAHLGTNF